MIGAIHPPKSGFQYRVLKNTIQYVLNPQKTGDGLYTGSMNCICDSEQALQEMMQTDRHYGKQPKNGHDRIGYHFTISWSRDENVSPELALEITRQFCETYLSEYEVVFSAHMDKKHMHTHICFHSVNCMTGRKYRYEDGDWEKIQQPLLDELCRKYGLHELETDTGIKLEDYAKERRKRKYGKNKNMDGKSHSNRSYRKENSQDYSFSDYIRFDIDTFIAESSDMEEFEQKMTTAGYEIRHGNSQKYGSYMAVRTAGMEKFRRTYALGKDYTEDMIRKRIEAKKEPPPEIPLEEGMQRIFPEKIYRLRIYYNGDNPFLQGEYKRLRRMGVIPKSRPHLSYKEVREQIAELRKLEYQIKMITEYGLGAEQEINAVMEELEKKVNEDKKEEKDLEDKFQPYKKELSVYQNMEVLEGAYLLFQGGDADFRKEAEDYIRYKKQADSFGHSREELEEFQNKFSEKKKNIRGQIKDSQKRLEALKELKEEYSQVKEREQNKERNRRRKQ